MKMCNRVSGHWLNPNMCSFHRLSLPDCEPFTCLKIIQLVVITSCCFIVLPDFVSLDNKARRDMCIEICQKCLALLHQ